MPQHLILSAQAFPGRGGQGLNLHNMIQALSTEYELTVFCDDDSLPSMHCVPKSQLAWAISKIPVVRRLHSWQMLFSSVHFDRYVSRHLPKADFFQGVVGQCAVSMDAARKNGCATFLDVITTHIDDFVEAANRECAKFGLRSPIHPEMRRRILKEYRDAGILRVMSQHALRTFLARDFARQRFIVAPPPFDLDEFTLTNFTQPKFQVCFVGMLEPWKGFHYLIEAFQRLEIRDAGLTLWGNTGSRPVARYLREQLIRDHRISVRAADVRQIGYENVYGKASVLVHPSISDGFAQVVPEAMASGIPVIVTSTTGASELVVDGKNGYIVQPRDIEGIRDRLHHLALRPALLREMGIAARETIRSLTMDAFRGRLVSGLSAANSTAR